jgi:hypothetical protein
MKMEEKENIGLKGTITCRIKYPNSNEWITLWTKPLFNKIPKVGRAYVAYLLRSDTPTSLTHGAIGSGAAGPTDDDVALGSQYGDRVASTRSQVTTTTTDDTAKWVTLFTASANWAVTEYGTFTAAVAGTMLNRLVFAVVNVPEDSQFEFTSLVQIKESA